MNMPDGNLELARIASALERNNELLAAQHEQTKKLLWEAQTSRRTQEVLRLSATAPTLDDVAEFARNRQLGFLETVHKIRDSRLSFARFGDGEMRLMLRPEYKLAFQKNSPDLAAALGNTLTRQTENLLIGFPQVYRDVHWSGVWSDIWGQFKPLVSSHAFFGNSHVSRPIFFQATGQAGVDAWRSVWDGLEVKVVTGKNSRFEMSPELFSSARSVTIEESLPINAFDDLTRLMQVLADDSADLILLSLGPAGTVLASELARAGRRAIDIGHISDSFENVFNGGEWPERKSVSRA